MYCNRTQQGLYIKSHKSVVVLYILIKIAHFTESTKRGSVPRIQTHSQLPPVVPQQDVVFMQYSTNHDFLILQKALGEEGMSLEFRHIASYLMWYCSRLPCEELLHEVILCVGYFTILNPENQVSAQPTKPGSMQYLTEIPRLLQYYLTQKL